MLPKEIIQIVTLIILVVLSAFFSGSEIIYAKVNKIKLKKNADKGEKLAIKAEKLSENYPELIATILVGNNLVNIAASSIATVFATTLWLENGPTIATIGMTLIILTFGEILPKTIFVKYNYKLCLKFSSILQVFNYIFKPVVFLVTRFVDKISKIWTPKELDPTATDEELITMVDEIEEEGYIDEDTGELVRSAIEFTDVTAHEIMKPRVDVFAFDIEDDPHDLLKDENIFNYSRIPVYKDSIDDIVGILNSKVLLKSLLAKKEIDIKSMLIQPIYVHKTKLISSLLQEFKKTHTHIAVVKDEFGGTLGIITLEDILEELVGDIWDETDTIEEEYQETEEGVYIVDGDMNIYDMFELVEYDDKDFSSEYETVGGWCTEVLERFPEVNDTFDFNNLRVTILVMDGIRVEKVKIEILEEKEEE